MRFRFTNATPCQQFMLDVMLRHASSYYGMLEAAVVVVAVTAIISAGVRVAEGLV